MTSIPGSDNLIWSDEQTRFFLQLRLDESLKGNIRKQMVNEAGRQVIVDKFYEAFGIKIPWSKFGIKYNTCKKQYDSFKKLTRNRTGLGFTSTGSINMSEDWWNERCKEWPGARKFKDKPIANMDLMEKVFGTVYISGGEGWSAQQGEEVLDTKQTDHDDEDDAESRRDVPTQEAVGDESRRGVPTQETDVASESRNVGSKNVGPSSSRSKVNKKRSRAVQAGQAVADVIRESVESRDKILSHKNHLIENHPEFSCSQLRAMEVLHSLPAIRMWSPLYKASINHLKQDAANRQTFLFYGDDENRVLYLEYATGESRDA
ncbi:hypothetical protein Bca52824_089035 [Brassica carinata]|uniref:Myb/SANT-like domain-containing protein n=1 Tax=Brassica carinata TaxID=52824 RepID=A0A8X7TPC9_BRACI|nr:hypothetical protein Bca52824_089035 [Brassica carinata]